MLNPLAPDLRRWKPARLPHCRFGARSANSGPVTGVPSDPRVRVQGAVSPAHAPQRPEPDGVEPRPLANSIPCIIPDVAHHMVNF